MKIIILLGLSLLFYSCNNQDKNISKNNIESKKEVKKELHIPSLPLISKEQINVVFFKSLLKAYKIDNIEAINENTRFLIAPYKKDAYNLYFKRSVPIQAGEYKSSGPFTIYDFVYDSQQNYKIACENLKAELGKLNQDNNNEYFDYFKGSRFVYFFDKIDTKITIISFSGVRENKEYDMIKNFSNNNKYKFEEIIFATSTSMKTQK